ncbi:uncharacterized protein A4U43_C02F4040 [Asparagus officinalis]|uniref:Secreted protein n=1 Tax=Asparagus officinalis TaxID=4686 RepID=A0A5P1FGG0_ASPOF|nr:uncharacterized protein A4U43_C02F4040 [Asparagus officinalis]
MYLLLLLLHLHASINCAAARSHSHRLGITENVTLNTSTDGSPPLPAPRPNTQMLPTVPPLSTFAATTLALPPVALTTAPHRIARPTDGLASSLISRYPPLDVQMRTDCALFGSTACRGSSGPPTPLTRSPGKRVLLRGPEGRHADTRALLPWRSRQERMTRTFSHDAARNIQRHIFRKYIVLQGLFSGHLSFLPEARQVRHPRHAKPGNGERPTQSLPISTSWATAARLLRFKMPQ